MIRQLKETTTNIFSDNGGGLSSLRIIMFIIVATVLFNWTYITIINKTYTPLDWQDVGTIVLPLVAKAYQKGKENNGDNKDGK